MYEYASVNRTPGHDCRGRGTLRYSFAVTLHLRVAFGSALMERGRVAAESIRVLESWRSSCHLSPNVRCIFCTIESFSWACRNPMACLRLRKQTLLKGGSPMDRDTALRTLREIHMLCFLQSHLTCGSICPLRKNDLRFRTGQSLRFWAFHIKYTFYPDNRQTLLQTSF